MCAVLMALILGAATDGPVRREPPPPRPAAIVASTPSASHVSSTMRSEPGPVIAQEYLAAAPAHSVGAVGIAYPFRPLLARRPGYLYYCKRIPCYGPTCYDYRLQFDYPWHR